VCDDAAFARRAYLDVIGMVPTLSELKRFMEDPSPEKRAALVDEFARATPGLRGPLDSVLGGRARKHQRQQPGGRAGRGSYRAWINESFRTNKAFDVFAAN
jgi:hypothetical protein